MNRIKELRTAAGWTQTQLGKRIGAAKSTVSEYESEKHQLDPVLICALCDLFGCTADYLLGRSLSPLPAVNDAQARLLAAYDAADPTVRESIDHLLKLDVPESKKSEEAS